MLNYYIEGLTEKTLTTRNLFQKLRLLYCLLFRDLEKGIYPVGDGIFVMGQLRVKGRYDARVCKT